VAGDVVLVFSYCAYAVGICWAIEGELWGF